MRTRVVEKFPEDDSCPNCGRRLIIIKWTDDYREAICEGNGHCGWWGYWER